MFGVGDNKFVMTAFVMRMLMLPDTQATPDRCFKPTLLGKPASATAKDVDDPDADAEDRYVKSSLLPYDTHKNGRMEMFISQRRCS